MKIAIIITGEVRDCPAKDKIKDLFRDFDVFCGSYSKHKDYISNLGKNNYCNLINEATGLIGPKAAVTSDMGIYFMSFGSFYLYNGSVQKRPCSGSSYVFSDINVGQAYKIQDEVTESLKKRSKW